MSEKVLGFKERKAKIMTEVDTYYQVEQQDLVPVVSVEELKEICQGLYLKSSGFCPTAQELLSAVRLQKKKEAVEEKE